VNHLRVCCFDIALRTLARLMPITFDSSPVSRQPAHLDLTRSLEVGLLVCKEDDAGKRKSLKWGVFSLLVLASALSGALVGLALV